MPAERGVTVLMEALPVGQCDVVTSLDEAAGWCARSIIRPSARCSTCHNAVDETEPHAALVERHYDLIRHIHVNELDGRHPGTGTYDFKPLFDVLRRRELPGLGVARSFRLLRRARKPSPANRSQYLENSMSKYVVTGGAGFIGSAIVRGLLAKARARSW